MINETDCEREFEKFCMTILFTVRAYAEGIFFVVLFVEEVWTMMNQFIFVAIDSKIYCWKRVTLAYSFSAELILLVIHCAVYFTVTTNRCI